MKKLVIYTIVFLFAKLGIAQTVKVSERLFKVNILSPGLGYEWGVGSNSTFNVDMNLSLGGVNDNNGQLKVLAVPFVRGQYRFYYNLDKRLDKGKSITGNSGGFVAPSISYYGKPINDDFHISTLDGFTAGAVWGFQKTYKSGVNLGANAGLGYNISKNQNNSIVPILNFTVAWVILK
ncbi:hypothetical protein FFWV33_00225 [Flavobacterium faecale]|uniref:Outer membrane protein beta-barrel domain-containing protein n=1 Tax=Flavobacterium faecale TaxID=1355330 RepID=A0A2S1L8I9_9FLAO|nr:DUF3575 domain-containing protein [Flavobacterium faecale]AWG20055.1 hypothetical protein FFWV33_00225 [Flavobacterium faecale]